MTNQVQDAITQEMSGMTFVEVEPGSPDDPFSVRSNPASANGTASPAFTIPAGTGIATPTDGNSQRPAAVTPSQTPNQTVIPATPATPAAELSPAEKALKEGRLDDYVSALANESAQSAVRDALRNQQSGYDRRINALQEELKTAREAAIKAEREAKLGSDDLTDEEKDTLRRKYDLDDREAALKEYEGGLDNYYRQLVVAKLVETHGVYGVTPEALDAFDEPEEMESFATAKELEHYRSGGTATVQTRQVESTTKTEPEENAPAGATAPSDVGGGPVYQPPAQLQQGAGSDILRSNLEKLPWESVRMPN